MENFLGQIMLFAGTFAPKGWLACDGQILAIAQNQALFSLIGVTYGGNGTTTFALPDLRGRIAVNTGQRAGATPVSLGMAYGTENMKLTVDQLPGHTHAMAGPVTVNVKANGSDEEGSDSPVGQFLRQIPGDKIYANAANATMGASPATIQLSPGGSGMPFSNLQPTLTMMYCIATTGLYPSRP